METMRQSWTDDRMDDLSRRMDQRFEQVDQRFAEVDRRFEQVDQRFDKVDREIGGLRTEMNMRFDSLQRTLFLGMCGLLAAVGAALVGVLAS